MSLADDWPTYVFGPGRDGYNSAETAITAGSANGLHLEWTIHAGAAISAQAVVSHGLVYWGAWDGVERATRLDGTQVWSANLGAAPAPPACGGPALGVLGAATVATVSIHGTPTAAVFVADGNDTFFAVNAATGAVLWQRQLAAVPSEIWDCSVVYKGSVYIAMASWGDCPTTQARVFQMDAATGTIQHTYAVVPNSCTGAGVWGSIAIDVNNGTLYFGTGNPGSCATTETNADAVVQLRASDLTYMS